MSGREDAGPRSDLSELPTRWQRGEADVLLLGLEPHEAEALPARGAWAELLRQAPIVVVLDGAPDDLVDALVQSGVQDVLASAEAAEPALLAQRLRLAVLRKRRECAAAEAWSTDLDTGLPNRQQLNELLSQMLALRARQPAAMAVLAVRCAGLASAAESAGASRMRSLARKVAVRLRAALRASDVVASLEPGVFAIVLSQLEASADAGRVAAKLAHALRKPLGVQGQAQILTAHIGIALHPHDGEDAAALLREAQSRALAAERQGTDAAND